LRIWAGTASRTTIAAEKGWPAAATAAASIAGIKRMPPPIARRMGMASAADHTGPNTAEPRSSRNAYRTMATDVKPAGDAAARMTT
jgi:hypothetical protein